jgi:sugar lactone lactonase YvrE
MIGTIRLFALLFGICMSLCLAASGSDIVIHEDGPNAESLTSTASGAVIFGSMAKAEIFRAAKGATSAEVWIEPSRNGLQRILGVLADERSGTLWVCSSGTGPNSAPTALKTFDLESGATKASYDFPGGTGLCNDIAVATDGTVYATDTTGNRVVVLKKGETALAVWAAAQKLAGIDGIALGDDKTVYVNTFFTRHLVRIAVGPDGNAGAMTELNVSMPLSRPDGMRSVRQDTMLLVEGGGRLDRVTIQGDNAKVEVLKDGLDGPRAVTLAGNSAWVLVGGVRAVAVPVH